MGRLVPVQIAKHLPDLVLGQFARVFVEHDIALARRLRQGVAAKPRSALGAAGAVAAGRTSRRRRTWRWWVQRREKRRRADYLIPGVSSHCAFEHNMTRSQSLECGPGCGADDRVTQGCNGKCGPRRPITSGRFVPPTVGRRSPMEPRFPSPIQPRHTKFLTQS